MDRMTGLLSNLWPWNANANIGEPSTMADSGQERISRAMRPYEAFVVCIQSLLIWENPVMSCIFVLAVNLLFWLVVTLEFRFYSLASLVMLFIFVYTLWVEQIWPEIRLPPKETPDSEGWTPLHPGVLSVPEISRHVNQLQNFVSSIYISAATMRQEQPGKFCAVASCALLILLFIGRSMSGAVLAYLTLMAAILLPGVCLHLLPEDTLDRLGEVKKKLVGIKSVLLFEEMDTTMTDSDSLVPEVTPEDMSLLNVHYQEEANEDDDDEIATLLPAGEISVIPENFSDSKAHALTPSLSFMPAHDEDSMDCADLPHDRLEESFDLIPPSPSKAKNNIKFKTKHFNGDDSSDDGSFSKGLTFADAPSPAVVQQEPESAVAGLGPFGEMITRAAVENVAKTLVDAMTSVAHSVVSTAALAAAQAPATSEADSDAEIDDFEIINQEDLPKFS
ncbi:reticulophagy regulator 3-like [Neocloeon triangulifer]|uniref:reticulophagy regulator 3-like n=1 Tax=Neocloeon triangulifer TaxID=2078957 RepID=UPI00286EE674|nr:reticulophagy regulator 3-like [Neocloeon triangulifer]